MRHDEMAMVSDMRRLTVENGSLKAYIKRLEGACNDFLHDLILRHPEILEKGYSCPYVKRMAGALSTRPEGLE